MKLFRNPELKGILGILLIVFILAVLLAGTSGKLEQWGLPWFTGPKAFNRIVFVSDRSGTREIYSMNLDGSDQKQLTEKAEVLSAPTVSPAGNKIAFVAMSGPNSHVFAIGVNGGSPYALTSSTNPKKQPCYSPDGKKIAYIEAGRVFVADLNGSNPEPVLPTEQEMAAAMSSEARMQGNGEQFGSPTIPRYSVYAWSPDSNGLAGVLSQGENGNQYMDALVYLPSLKAESQRFPRPSDVMHVTGVSWAADEPVMAATIDVPAEGWNAWLVAYDARQKQFKPLLDLSAVKLGTPALSPDGSTVVVPVIASNKNQALGLLRVDVESRKPALLCKGKFENPVYSPKGDSILAAQYDQKTSKRGVVTIDPESGKVTQLATNGDCFDAVWSPQSK